MGDIHPGYLIGLLVFLLLCSAFFSSVETGVLSLDRYRLRHQAKQGNRAARRTSWLLLRTDRLLGTILIGNNLVNVIASSLATLLALRLWGDFAVAPTALALTLVLLIFGEITPKTYATLRPERVAFPASLPLLWLQRLFSPLLWLMNGVSNGILRLCGLDPAQRRSRPLNNDELRSVVSESSEKLSANRQDMLLSILDLEKITVNDLMVPRNEVQGIDLDDDVESIIGQLRNTTHTRLPVFRNDINQVEGIVHMRQIARLLTHNQLTKDSLRAACLEPYFIPESTPLATQLINFQKQKRRIGIVVDEYGEVIGIITLEDILEEIVGEFSNADALRNPDIHPQADGTYVIDGSANIRELNRALGWQLPSEGPKTLNGLVTEALEQIPDCPVCLRIGPYRLEILQSGENRVKSVRVWLTGRAAAPAPGSADGLA
ncbi:HlyC/CorC family transporter [Pseudomonas citronellolis]|uniref:HlyC/CorC family transporter n=1 Tax=Pseudomonas citronellolis TaxID=53408 RepID=UPI0020A13800|nr:HlyC/CorC family transporter [Pseudomonas citronellolis]MCP1602295.1 Mg2+/Co2+ transporter CorB [Pseudomonas citronellolis]MCP1652982.1 Mg2+/Co2+ transporter CorB [Pseudomonas citronellolis]MCP1719927.1 Mg2+/Co2+ transporter CorB [Pseudomonas citronellolis]